MRNLQNYAMNVLLGLEPRDTPLLREAYLQLLTTAAREFGCLPAEFNRMAEEVVRANRKPEDWVYAGRLVINRLEAEEQLRMEKAA